MFDAPTEQTTSKPMRPPRRPSLTGSSSWTSTSVPTSVPTSGPISVTTSAPPPIQSPQLIAEQKQYAADVEELSKQKNDLKIREKSLLETIEMSERRIRDLEETLMKQELERQHIKSVAVPFDAESEPPQKVVKSSTATTTTARRTRPQPSIIKLS